MHSGCDLAQSPCASVLQRFLKSVFLLSAVLSFAAQAASSGFYNEVHCLCIGINQYQSSGIATLQRAEDDAKAVADVLESNYGYRVERLLGQAATKAAITNKLHGFKDRLGPDDALLIFFAGHGQAVELPRAGSAGFLVPFDARVRMTGAAAVQEWEAEAIGMSYLGDFLKDMKCRHALLLTDCCYSGYFGRRSALAGRVDLRELLKLKSRVAITAGTETQAAFEQANMAHGYYTTALLQELRKPAPAGVSEIFTELREQVANRTNGKMLPQFREIAVENGEFVFIPKAVKKESFLSTAGEFVQRLVRRRGAQMTTREDVLDALTSVGYRQAVNVQTLEKEWQARFQRFADNASLGQSLAMVGLSYCYARGLGTATNRVEAGLWARRAVELDLPEGKHALGLALLNGYGIDRNVEAGEQLLKESAEANLPESCYELALHLGSSGTDSGRFAEAKRLLEKSNAQGFDLGTIALARVCMGRLISEDVPRFPPDLWDKARGVKLIESLKDSTLPQTDYERYVLWSKGEAGYPPKSTDKALEALRRAANAGYARAQAFLASEHYAEPSAFEAALALRKNVAEARKWAELAAVQGNSDAAVLLATLLGQGTGIRTDWTAARRWLDEAASRNYPRALWTKGAWVSEGRCGYDKDEAKGLALREEAALQSLDYAFILARRHSSWSDKLRWYLVAASQHGDLAAEDEMFFFLMRANRTQRSDAENKALEDFFSQHREWGQARWGNGDTWFARAERGKSMPVFEGFGVWSVGREFGGNRMVNQYYDGPGAYAWDALAMAAANGSAKAKEILSRGVVDYYLERSTNYLQKGLAKEALWSHVEALRMSEGKLPKTSFVALAKQIPLLFKNAKDWDEREIGRLFGRTRDAMSDDGSLREQTEEKIERLKSTVREGKAGPHGLRAFAETVLVDTFLVMASLSESEQKAWDVGQTVIQLCEGIRE